MRKRVVGGIGLVLIAIVATVVWFWSAGGKGLISPLGKPLLEKPLDKYTFEALRQRTYKGSDIKIDHLLKSGAGYSAWIFYFATDGKKVSGVINLPAKVSSESAFLENPVVIMLHGFATQQEYYPGFGTERVAAVLAQNGYVTLAPDYLGFATSDAPSPDPFEDRFLTYTTALNLISTVENTKSEIRNTKQGSNISKFEIRNSDLYIWAHSNGGQIALSILEISGKPVPTVLWNPVSKHFPYNILYYIDTFDDQGKGLRKALAKFEDDYDVDKYDTALFYDRINAPILLQQGQADEWVPLKWSDDLYAQFKKFNSIKVEYKTYPGSDHNMMPKWNEAVNDVLKFFDSGYMVKL